MLHLASLNIRVVGIGVDVLDNLLEVPAINLNAVRVIRAGPSQLLCVRVQIIIHQCHLDAIWVCFELLFFKGLDLTSDLIKDVVAFFGKT